MSTIPDQSPEGSVPASTTPRPDYTLFNYRSVALATFLGTPIAGGILMAVNERRLGNAGRAAGTVILAILGTAVLLLVGWFIPQTLDTFVALGAMFAMMRIAKSTQEMSVEEHVRLGGQVASMWKAAGIGVAALVVVFGAAAGGIYLHDRVPAVVIGSNDKVYYTGTATRAEALSLGNALQTAGYFRGEGAAVVLEKSEFGTNVSFVVKDGAWNDVSTVEEFEMIGLRVGPSVGLPIIVYLTDKHRDPQTDSNVGQVVNGKDHLYYLGDADEDQANALSDELKSEGYFAGKGVDVFLSIHKDDRVISYVVNQTAWTDPADVRGFQELTRKVVANAVFSEPTGDPNALGTVAPAHFKLPIQVHLVDSSMTVQKALTVDEEPE